MCLPAFLVHIEGRRQEGAVKATYSSVQSVNAHERMNPRGQIKRRFSHIHHTRHSNKRTWEQHVLLQAT